MTALAILNDLHIGTLRSAGTTTQSAKALRLYALERFDSMLEEIDTDLVINGDMFDGFQVPLSDALVALKALQKWLEKGHKLYLLPGNHDLSTDSSKLSTFEFVAQILEGHPNCTYLKGAGWLVEGSVYAISHVPNQDLFDMELANVPECDYLLLHCNWDNGFARELDHSLNLDRSVAEKLPAKRTILAHEHSGAEHLGGRVVISGNQFPMSINDCLGKQSKYRTVLTGGGNAEYLKTWDSGDYKEVDWTQAATANAPFIRVVGKASDLEAAEAVDAVAKLRRVSDAFIVGSAVKIGSSQDTLDMTEALASVEDVRAFDVMGALKELLKPEQVAALESLR